MLIEHSCIFSYWFFFHAANFAIKALGFNCYKWKALVYQPLLLGNSYIYKYIKKFPEFTDNNEAELHDGCIFLENSSYLIPNTILPLTHARKPSNKKTVKVYECDSLGLCSFMSITFLQD